MKSPPHPTHEWRVNNGLHIKTYNGSRFHDLYVGNEYQHIWLREDLSTGKFELARAGMSEYIGDFDSIREAEDHIRALDVIDRFERAYG